MAGDGYKLPLIPYVNGAKFDGVTATVAPNGGYSRYSNLSAAKSLWSDTPTTGDTAALLVPPPSGALISVNTKDVRVTSGGYTPTATEGLLWVAGSALTFSNEQDFLKALLAIETAATAEVTIQWFHQWN